jgi:hypothetical protein
MGHCGVKLARRQEERVVKVVTLCIAAVCSVAAGPVLAATPAAPVSPVLQTAQNDDFASQKAKYEAQARKEMDVWQRRMAEAGTRTQTELDHAWSVTKQQWTELQHATAVGWDRSRAAFDRATARMKAEWDKRQQNG